MAKLGATERGVLQERDTTPGPLYRSHPPGGYEHLRWPAAAALEPWIEKHWSVTWDLAPGERHVQHVLTHPCAHLVDEGGEARVDALLVARAPEPDEGFEIVSEAARLTLSDPGVARVEELAARLAVSGRTLQRLFRERVGVTPKWMLKRYRLHAAAERITEGEVGDWAALALDLGYFDQAHFIRDFKAVVGRTPADYAAAIPKTRRGA